METADYLASQFNLPIQETPEMGEVQYGKWEGKKIKKLAKKKAWGLVQFFPSRFQFPEGETFSQVQTRAVNALEKLSKQHDKEFIVVCSHADVIKLVLAHYLGTHMDLFQRIGISPASVSVLHLPASGHVQVLRLNDSGPLKAPEGPKASDEESAKE
jgi:probable phosphoglycerate mutase